MKYFFSILVSTFVVFYNAQAQLTGLEDSSEDKFCHALMQAKQQKLSFAARLELLRELYLLKVLPSFYSKPIFNAIDVPASEQRLSTLPSSGANLIFLPGPLPADWLRFSSDREAQLKQTQLQEKIKKQNEHLTKLLKSKNVEDCNNRKRKLGFEYQTYLAQLNDLQKTPWKSQHKELEIAKKSIRKLLKKLDRSWMLVEYTTISDIFKAIKDSRAANVVIVTHGKSNGHLLDSQFVTYPLGIFAQVAPSLVSINLFSCYSNQSLQLYEIQKHFKENQSYYRQRLVTTVAERNDQFTGQVAPLEGLRSYLKKLDKKITSMSAHNQVLAPATETLNQTCSLRLNGLLVNKGLVTVELNRQLLAIVDNQHTQENILFDCRLINQRGNLLVLRPASPEMSSSILSEGFSVQSQDLSLQSVQQFRHSDGSFRSIIVR
jgi:hypothetical protein